MDNVHLDDQERDGNFQLAYIPLKQLKKYLINNIGDLKINKIVTNEMLQALRYLKKSGVLK